MKKMLVIMGVLVSAFCFSAFTVEMKGESTTFVSLLDEEDEYTKLELSDLPEVVKTGIEKKYPELTIKEVSVAEKDEKKTYKIILTTKDDVETTVFFNEEGEEIVQETKE